MLEIQICKDYFVALVGQGFEVAVGSQIGSPSSHETNCAGIRCSRQNESQTEA
jgi:hypothetical protein